MCGRCFLLENFGPKQLGFTAYVTGPTIVSKFQLITPSPREVMTKKLTSATGHRSVWTGPPQRTLLKALLNLRTDLRLIC